MLPSSPTVTILNPHETENKTRARMGVDKTPDSAATGKKKATPRFEIYVYYIQTVLHVQCI